MVPALAVIPAPLGPIVRVARRGNEPFAPPAWDYAEEDGTFGNRFDDPGQRPDPSGQRGIIEPERRFRTIYCATDSIGAFGETLARVRPNLAHGFVDPGYIPDRDDPEPEDLYLKGICDPSDPTRGVVSDDWRSARVICATELDHALRFADFTSPDTISHLRRALGPLAHILQLTDIDFSTVVGPMRTFTQECSRYVYEQTDTFGNPLFAGIRYFSRHTPQWECWALFDHRVAGHHHPGFPESILPDNPALMEVARLYGLTITRVSGSHLRP